jgi:hypothetical protein
VPTPLLTCPAGTDGDWLVSQPCRLHARILAWLGSWWLDQSLAAGVSPDAGAMLSLRAHRLIGLTTRRALAAELRELVPRARRVPHPLDNGVCVCAVGVLEAHEAISELADRLDGWEPVEPRGVARVRLLLRDGTGPLYSESPSDELRRAVRAALAALEPTGI